MILLLFLILGFILIFINKKFIQNTYVKTFIKCIAISLILGAILEGTIFNYRHYESFLFKNNQSLTNYTLGSGITCKNNLCEITDYNQAYIEIKNINKNVSNLYIDILNPNKLIIDFKIYFSDAANRLYLDAGERTYLNNIKNSKFIRVHPSGNLKNLKLKITSANGKFTIKNIEINKKVPLMINNIRLLLTTLLVLITCLINPKSNLQDIKYNHKISRIIVVLTIISLSLIFYKLTTYNTSINNNTGEYSNQSQYKNLAASLAQGHFYLDMPVSDKLLELKNPYDTVYRNSKLKTHVDYYWDYAFYNGKYYSYFGIVPCLLMYLPTYLITHQDLPNNIAITITSILFLISSFYLIYQILNKYFKNTSLIWYFLITFLYVFSSGLVIILGCPTFYFIPIHMALTFAGFGLAFWIKSTTTPKLNKKYLLLGSLSMAIVAGCRPQVLLTMFASIIIFWDYIFHKRELFSKKSVKETICFMAPFIIVALLLMYYNYARFGSPFDFGANYNLTSNDMTKRGFKFDRIPTGIYHMLLSPITVSPIFPFITRYRLETTYIGKTITETMYGGFLFTNIICILGILSYKFKNIINNKELYRLSIFFVIASLIILIADTEMAGVLARYIADFGFLITLSTIIVMLSLLKKYNHNITLKKVLTSLIMISIIFNIILFFRSENLFATNEQLYYKLYYLFTFYS